MRRRRLLACIGVSATTIATGRLGVDVPSDDADLTVDGAETGRKPEGEDGTPDDPGDRSCPPYSTDRERAVCSHTVDEESASVYLDADPETTGLDDCEPAEPITLTLENRSSGDLRFNPASWSIWHDPGDGWTELPPEISGDGVTTLPAGETHSWTFLEAVESIRPEPNLEPGRYAAELGVPDPAGGGWLACIALVRLEGG